MFIHGVNMSLHSILSEAKLKAMGGRMENYDKVAINAYEVSYLNLSLPPKHGEEGLIEVEGSIWWTLNDVIQESGDIRLVVVLYDLSKMDVISYDSSEKHFYAVLYGKFKTSVIKKL